MKLCHRFLEAMFVRRAPCKRNALLRFDFTHFESMTREQIAAVEDMVNRQILKNIPLETIESFDLEQAREMGAKLSLMRNTEILYRLYV